MDCAPKQPWAFEGLGNNADAEVPDPSSGNILTNNSSTPTNEQTSHVWTLVGSTYPKLVPTFVVPISEIEYDENAKSNGLAERINASVKAPWGKVIEPLLCTKLPNPKDGKKWRLRHGWETLHAVRTMNPPLTHIPIEVLEGAENDIERLLREHDLLRLHPNAFEQLNLTYAWDSAIKTLPCYSQGGDQAKKKKEAQQNSLPSTQEEYAYNITKLKPTAYHSEVNAIKNLPESTKQVLWKMTLEGKTNIVTKKRQIKDLAKMCQSHPTRVEQINLSLPTACHPDMALYQAIQSEAKEKAKDIKQDQWPFEIYNEHFHDNYQRAVDKWGKQSISLVFTDIPWLLQDADQQGTMWKEHGQEISPAFTTKELKLLCEDVINVMTLDGYFLVMHGQEGADKIRGMILQHGFQDRGMLAYIHPSGSGTLIRKAGLTSHWRMISIFRHPQAPPMDGKYHKFMHDTVPPTFKLPKTNITTEEQLHRLEQEKEYLLSLVAEYDERIARIRAGGLDPYLDDTMYSMVKRIEDLKMWHPWTQSVDGGREVIRRFPRGNGRMWEPCLGVGSFAIAAVTCTYHLMNPQTGKFESTHIPWQGIGCEIMPGTFAVAKFRLGHVLQALKEKNQSVLQEGGVDKLLNGLMNIKEGKEE